MIGSSPHISRRRWSAATLLAGLLLLFCAARPAPAPDSDIALVLSVDGTINPAVSDYIATGLERATARQAGLVIIEMNTPGGLDASMRDIIEAILAAEIPVASYVFPEGARAASAGTYILYASHVAAMAPATNLGAATPVQIGGFGGGEQEKEGEDTDGEQPGSAMERKITNDASAYIKALAEKHGRNAEWAVRAVREAVSLTAEEALAENVIDIVAADLDDLLAQLDGVELSPAGEPLTLATTGLRVERFEPSWRYKVLGIISDPTIAYLLLLLGFYGLIYELANPGFLLPGVAGGIALVLALYAFQLLPVNYSGLALMILGIAFLVGEAFLPSFGVLGIGGVIAFAAGSLILIDDETLRVSLVTIVTTTAVSALFVLLLVGRAVTMRRKRVHTGAEAMVGMIAEARADFNGDGTVLVSGESWRARSTGPVSKGDKVRILAITGLDLLVEPLNEEV